MFHATAAQLMLIVCSHHVSASEFWPHNFLDSSNIIIIITIKVVIIFIAFKMMIIWLLLMFKVISIWNYRNWRERGGGKGKFSKAHRINYDARFTDVACINPVQKTNKIWCDKWKQNKNMLKPVGLHISQLCINIPPWLSTGTQVTRS